jgi:Nucleotide modification associated domain 3
MFGQSVAAQGHLRSQGIGPGDLFICFGPFRPTERWAGGYRWQPGISARHVGP